MGEFKPRDNNDSTEPELETESDAGVSATDPSDAQWNTIVTIDAPNEIFHGRVLNPFITRDSFDMFKHAVARAVEIRNDPHESLDCNLDTKHDVNIKITQSEPPQH